MRFIFITNNTDKARIADAAGVDSIFVDLERHGKAARQPDRTPWISDHSFDDISRIQPCLVNAELLVRIDPLGRDSKNQIDSVLGCGVNRLIIPMLRSYDEVQYSLELIDGRAKFCLLVETPELLASLYRVLEGLPIDNVHLGLNDLSRALGLRHMFELFANGFAECFAKICNAQGVLFGIGGVAPVGMGEVSPNLLISEHARLGSKQVILSRAFNSLALNKDIWRQEIDALREIYYVPHNMSEREQSSTQLRSLIRELAEKLGKES